MEDIQQTTDNLTEPPAPARPSKAATVTKLLSRNRSATLAEIMEATHWQSHSARAFPLGHAQKAGVPQGNPAHWRNLVSASQLMASVEDQLTGLATLSHLI